MKNLLFLDHASALGGAEKSLLYILENLDRKLWHPVLGCPPGPLSEAAAALGVEIIRIDFPRLKRSVSALADLLGGIRRLAELIGQHSIDLFYANTVRAAFYGAMTARRVGRPFIWHMREFWLSENPPRSPGLDRLTKKVIGGPAKLILVNSNATAAHLPFRRKISVVHNGIDPVWFTPEAEDESAKVKFDIPRGAPVVGVVGRLRPIKGFDRFLHVAAQIAAVRPDVWFLVVGGEQFSVGDRFEENLHELAEELNIADRVIFTGHVEDVRPAMAAMDLFVNPGDPEAFGLVNIEAMAMRLPVIAYDHGALPEIVEQGKSGVLIPPGDEGSLASAILDLLGRPNSAKQLGLEGRRRVENHFSAHRMVMKISDILRDISS